MIAIFLLREGPPQGGGLVILVARRLAAVRSVVLRLRLRAPGTPAGTPASSWAGSLRHATHLAAIFLRCRV